MSSYVGNDPFEAAANAELGPRNFFGQVAVIAQFAILQKGIGRVPFDPAQHKLDQRVTEIKLEVIALPEHNMNRPLLREMIAESTEWASVVLPSLKALGITNPRELDGKFVQVQMAPTGRVYKDKNTGEEKKSTTFKFLALYENELACRLAYQAAHPGGNGTATAATPTAPAGTAAPLATPERAAALGFLDVLAKQAAGNRADLAAKIAAMPMISKYFTVDSPEAQLALAKYVNGSAK